MFLQAYYDRIFKTRDRLKTVVAGCRGLWKISNTLLIKAGCTENISALLRPDGSWDMDPEEKANELAETFRSKAQLPHSVSNAYSLLPEHPPARSRVAFFEYESTLHLNL